MVPFSKIEKNENHSTLVYRTYAGWIPCSIFSFKQLLFQGEICPCIFNPSRVQCIVKSDSALSKATQGQTPHWLSLLLVWLGIVLDYSGSDWALFKITQFIVSDSALSKPTQCQTEHCLRLSLINVSIAWDYSVSDSALSKTNCLKLLSGSISLTV